MRTRVLHTLTRSRAPGKKKRVKPERTLERNKWIFSLEERLYRSREGAAAAAGRAKDKELGTKQRKLIWSEVCVAKEIREDVKRSRCVAQTRNAAKGKNCILSHQTQFKGPTERRTNNNSQIRANKFNEKYLFRSESKEIEWLLSSNSVNAANDDAERRRRR